MEKYSGMTDAALLLDNYGEYSEMLPSVFSGGGLCRTGNRDWRRRISSGGCNLCLSVFLR